MRNCRRVATRPLEGQRAWFAQPSQEVHPEAKKKSTYRKIAIENRRQGSAALFLHRREDGDGLPVFKPIPKQKSGIINRILLGKR